MPQTEKSPSVEVRSNRLPTVANGEAAVVRRGKTWWPAHRKVILLGVCLLATSGGVAAIGFAAISAVHATHQKLAEREAPALALLLQADRDLYQAQLGLERATNAQDVLERKIALDLYAENVVQSKQRFEAYLQFASDDKVEIDARAAYAAERAKWLATTIELSRQLTTLFMPKPRGDALALSTAGSGGMLAESVSAVDIEKARVEFAAMREQLNVIVDKVYQPAVEASAAISDSSTRRTRWALLSGMGLALVAGVALTRSTARALLIQQRAADVVEAARTNEARRQSFDARLGRGLEMTHDEPETLKLIAEVLQTSAPTVAAEILLADSSRAHLLQAATTRGEHQGRQCAVAKPSACPAVRCGHALTFASSSVFDACPHLKRRPDGHRSAVCVPLSIMGQTVGVLHATAPDNELPDDDQIRMLEQVASKAGERLGILRAFRRTEAQASSDPLTGLMNRRSFEEKVHELGRQQIPFSVVYGDLDQFKNLNDTHGHETGDKALRTFAQTLKSSIRPGDLAARWGGEEFVIVLPRTSCDDAGIVLERVRQALVKAQQSAGTPVFTVSFGVALMTEESLFVDVLAQADECLLRAKREGRNRTITASGHKPGISDASATLRANDLSATPVAA